MRSIVVEWSNNEEIIIFLGEARVDIIITTKQDYGTKMWVGASDCYIKFKRGKNRKGKGIAVYEIGGSKPDIVEKVKISYPFGELSDDHNLVEYRVVLSNGFVFRGGARPIVEEEDKKVN